MTPGWKKLAHQVLDQCRSRGLLVASAPSSILEEGIADVLAQSVPRGDGVPSLARWLLASDDIDEVFADDAQLAVVLREAMKRVPDGELESSATAEPVAGTPADEALARQLMEHWARSPLLPDRHDTDGPQRHRCPDDSKPCSKFGGAAFLVRRQTWPTCCDCGDPMRLLVQLDLSMLPPELSHPHRQGLVQLFHCTRAPATPSRHSTRRCHTPSVFACWRSPAELRDPAERVDDPFAVDPLDEGAEQPLVVRRWNRGRPELPATPHELTSAHPVDPRLLAATSPRRDDKLGGWPAWPSQSQYPQCKECGTALSYLLQLEPGGLSRCHFEVEGVRALGMLFQCSTVPEHVAFRSFPYPEH
ncbi:MAG: DUF1963 domain-containing protein [Deltaproteobacteria bacterium]|nr:DUF1963 domain-containing protein [Deltaproteobacteria bacterium]